MNNMVDVEAMLAACIPGGDIADPQVIADNIREWFEAQPSPAGQGEVRAQFEAWARTAFNIARSELSGEYVFGNAAAAWEAWQAAAQPSPGGQGDAKALLDRYDVAGLKFRESLQDDRFSDARRVELRRELDAVQAELMVALAASQPVGEPVAWLIERLRGKAYGRDKYFVIKGQASSDPDSHLFWTDQQARDNHRVTPLYADQTSQSVDLRQFRTKVTDVLRSEFDLEVADPEDHRHDDGSAEADRIAGRIVALIDSKAVGK